MNQYFVSTFQKVGTFTLVNGAKQGGNVASYFCTPSGNVLNAIAGPVDAGAMLREARWTVETRKMALLDSRNDFTRYKKQFRLAHARQLQTEPAYPVVDWQRMPLYRSTGATLSTYLEQSVFVRRLSQQGRVHALLAVFPLVKLDEAYKVVYEKIVGEQVSTEPVHEVGSSPLVSRPQTPGTGGGGGCGGGVPRVATGGCGGCGGGIKVGGCGGCGGCIGGAATGFTPAPLPIYQRGVNRSVREFAETGDRAVAAQEAQARALERARTQPSDTEIHSGSALNLLLADLVQDRESKATPAAAPVAAEVLEHINLTARDVRGNSALLRKAGQITWPDVWQEKPLAGASARLRKSVESALQDTISLVQKGKRGGASLRELERGATGLKGVLADHAENLSFTEHTEANRFLAYLSGAVALLQRGDAAKHVNGSYALDAKRIKTVGDLVGFMAEKRLTFAPALPGDEDAYAQLQRLLAGPKPAGPAAGKPAALALSTNGKGEF
jgi:hypothetical protein